MPANAPSISVILATHNGGERLRKTLSSMQSLESPTGGWKLIIIDNASTDNTPDIIASFKDKLPLHSLSHNIPGKNGALNKALPLIEGELAIFTDDDVIVPKNWLIDYRALANSKLEFSVFGGRIVPEWPTQPSKAILEGVSIGDAYAVHESELPDGEINPGKIWGPNMAVRSSLFAKGAKYNENIGPSGRNYIPGSESSFNIEQASKGHKFYFSNQIVVRHQIRPEQLTLSWIKGRAFRLGRGQIHWSMQAGELDPKHDPMPRWFFTQLLRSYFRLALFSLSLNAVEKMKAIWQLNVTKGSIDEFKTIKKSKP